MEAEDLQQQLSAKPIWSAVRRTQDLISNAVKNFHKLPPHVFVPHMRNTTTFTSDSEADSEAINKPAIVEELKLAQLYIDSIKPFLEACDFIALGIEDAVA